MNITVNRSVEADPDAALDGYLPKREAGAGIWPGAVLGGPAVTNALRSTLGRLEEVLDQETAALAAFDLTRIDEFGQRKSRVLLELTRLGRSVPDGASSTIGDLAARVRTKLADNERQLRLHLEASREINEVLTAAVRETESDGTYEMPLR